MKPEGETWRVLDLFSGIGLMSLGLGWAGMRTVGFCELEPACRFWLRQHWPNVPIFEDVRTLTGGAILEACGSIDLLAGGFPCQPVSVAGTRRGADDARWLWPDMFRLVREVRPRWVLAENVPGLRTLGADGILADLDSEGYAAWPLVVGANDAGAPHRRKRVWLVAYRDGSGFNRERLGGIQHGERAKRGHDANGCGKREMGAGEAEGSGGIMGNANGARLALREGERGDPCQEFPALVRAGDPTRARGVVARPGQPQREWEAPRLADSNRRAAGRTSESGRAGRSAQPNDTSPRTTKPELGGAANGRSGRLAPGESALRRARLRAWGNGVYAPLVQEIGRAIMRADE